MFLYILWTFNVHVHLFTTIYMHRYICILLLLCISLFSNNFCNCLLYHESLSFYLINIIIFTLNFIKLLYFLINSFVYMCECMYVYKCMCTIYMYMFMSRPEVKVTYLPQLHFILHFWDNISHWFWALLLF